MLGVKNKSDKDISEACDGINNQIIFVGEFLEQRLFELFCGMSPKFILLSSSSKRCSGGSFRGSPEISLFVLTMFIPA